jgi:hypothetical protein
LRQRVRDVSRFESWANFCGSAFEIPTSSKKARDVSVGDSRERQGGQKGAPVMGGFSVVERVVASTPSGLRTPPPQRRRPQRSQRGLQRRQWRHRRRRLCTLHHHATRTGPARLGWIASRQPADGWRRDWECPSHVIWRRFCWGCRGRELVGTGGGSRGQTGGGTPQQQQQQQQQNTQHSTAQHSAAAAGGTRDGYSRDTVRRGGHDAGRPRGYGAKICRALGQPMAWQGMPTALGPMAWQGMPMPWALQASRSR